VSAQENAQAAGRTRRQVNSNGRRTNRIPERQNGCSAVAITTYKARQYNGAVNQPRHHMSTKRYSGRHAHVARFAVANMAYVARPANNSNEQQKAGNTAK
jgi:hypothetical protein